MFKGMLYPLLSAGALNSIYFGVYGVSLDTINKLKYGDGVKKPGFRSSKLDIFFAGCTGGFAQLSVSCPVDLVKIKLQTQTGHGGAMASPDTHYRGPFDVLKQMYLERGIKDCYKGLGAMAWR